MYPGSPDFPKADLAKKQLRNGGSIVSFDLKSGLKAGERLLNYFARKETPMEVAVSLGRRSRTSSIRPRWRTRPSRRPSGSSAE
jgi:cystathionine beta-lyase/cystathionine gamma-synthase